MSGSLESGNILQNQLFQAASGQTLQAGQRNALNLTGLDLANQSAQQGINTTDMAVTAQAAASLLNLDEDHAAAAYPGIKTALQAQGFGKNLPAAYPGHDAAAAFVSRAMPVGDQYKLGLITPPGFADMLKHPFDPTAPGGQQGAAAPTTGGGTPGPSGEGVALGMRQNNPGNLMFAGQPGAAPGQGNRFATFPDMATGVAATADQLARNQTAHGVNTVRGQVTRWVSDPKADLGTYIADTAKALGVGPDDPIDWTNPKTQAAFIQAQQPHESGGGGAKLDPADVAKGVQMAAAQRGQAVQARPAQQATAGATPAPYQIAGPPVGPPSAAPAPDLMGPRPRPPIGAGAPVPPTPQALANTPVNGLAAPAQAPPLAAAPVQAAQAAPPTQLMPAATAQPPPQAPPSPQGGTGINSPQFQTAQAFEKEALRLAGLPGAASNPTAQALIKYYQTQAAAYRTADTWEQMPDGSFRSRLTGEPKFAPTPRGGTDAAGNTFELLPGGGVKYTTLNPSGITGNTPEANAMRTIAEIGPKIADGTATRQEQANYATATETYRQPEIHVSPIDQSLQRINKRELPPGMPEPPGIGMSGSPPLTGAQPVTQGMSIAQRAAEQKLGDDFATTDKKSYDAANTSMGMLDSANNNAEILNRTPGGWAATGAGANTRMDLAKGVNQAFGLFGITPAVPPEQIGAWEALNKQTRLMGMQVVNNYFGGSREAASIINGATTAVPNSENTYLGFRLVSSGIEQDLIRQKELYEFKAQELAKPGGKLLTAEADFNKSHPVQTYTARAIANAVPDDIAAHLTANPDTVAAFDKHFGPGIGEFILKGGRTRMGSAAAGPPPGSASGG